MVYIPLLLTRRGEVGADTKSYLYLDPGRLLSDAPYMWDPGTGLGTVTHQVIGYSWPMGPSTSSSTPWGSRLGSPARSGSGR